MMEQMFDSRFEPALNPNAPRDTAMGMFYTEAVKDDIESKKQGRAIYRDQVMVKIRVPGDKFNEPIHRVKSDDPNDPHILRFPRSWEAFQKGQKSAVEGTPIEQWPLLTPAQVQMLKGADVLSVEQLAGLLETKLPNIPDIHRMKARAKDWLDSAAGNADATRLAEDLRDLKERFDRREERITQLEAALAAFREPVKRKYTKRVNA